MRIGIVGSEGAKFTNTTEVAARAIIRSHLHPGDVVISGGCHLGGIDIWAVEEAIKSGLDVVEHKPAKLQWEGGYRQRNIEIAKDSDIVICITVREFPPDYKGMRFPYCYHCDTHDHIKSGGCWTVKWARKLGKEGYIFVV
jgi:hypothetical protein